MRGWGWGTATVPVTLTCKWHHLNPTAGPQLHPASSVTWPHGAAPHPSPAPGADTAGHSPCVNIYFPVAAWCGRCPGQGTTGGSGLGKWVPSPRSPHAPPKCSTSQGCTFPATSPAPRRGGATVEVLPQSRVPSWAGPAGPPPRAPTPPLHLVPASTSGQLSWHRARQHRQLLACPGPCGGNGSVSRDASSGDPGTCASADSTLPGLWVPGRAVPSPTEAEAG